MLFFDGFRNESVPDTARFDHRSPHRDIHRVVAIVDEAGAVRALALLAIAGVIITSFGCALLMIARPGNPLSRVLRLYARTAGALPEYCLAVGGIFVFYSILHWAPAPDGLLSPVLHQQLRETQVPLLTVWDCGRNPFGPIEPRDFAECVPCRCLRFKTAC